MSCVEQERGADAKDSKIARMMKQAVEHEEQVLVNMRSLAPEVLQSFADTGPSVLLHPPTTISIRLLGSLRESELPTPKTDSNITIRILCDRSGSDQPESSVGRLSVSIPVAP